MSTRHKIKVIIAFLLIGILVCTGLAFAEKDPKGAGENPKVILSSLKQKLMIRQAEMEDLLSVKDLNKVLGIGIKPDQIPGLNSPANNPNYKFRYNAFFRDDSTIVLMAVGEVINGQAVVYTLSYNARNGGSFWNDEDLGAKIAIDPRNKIGPRLIEELKVIYANYGDFTYKGDLNQGLGIGNNVYLPAIGGFASDYLFRFNANAVDRDKAAVLAMAETSEKVTVALLKTFDVLRGTTTNKEIIGIPSPALTNQAIQVIGSLKTRANRLYAQKRGNLLGIKNINQELGIGRDIPLLGGPGNPQHYFDYTASAFDKDTLVIIAVGKTAGGSNITSIVTFTINLRNRQEQWGGNVPAIEKPVENPVAELAKLRTGVKVYYIERNSFTTSEALNKALNIGTGEKQVPIIGLPLPANKKYSYRYYAAVLDKESVLLMAVSKVFNEKSPIVRLKMNLKEGTEVWSTAIQQARE